MDLRLTSMCKRFGDVVAVDDVSLTVRGGEVLALLGENGAGKSSLMKLVYGVHRRDAGTIEIDGRVAQIDSPRDAMRHGIGMVFQQFSLVGALTVRENLALVRPHAPWWIGLRAARLADLDAHLADIAPGVEPTTRVDDLPVAQRQLVELSKVLLRDARCVILDEPSAVLAPHERARLWQAIRRLVARGLAVVLVTHKTADVRACATRLAVMRAGRLALEAPAAGLGDEAIVHAMVGHAPARGASPRAPASNAIPRLVVQGLHSGRLCDFNLVARAGEIVGIAGISGQGQADLVAALAGTAPVEAGEVILDGHTLCAPRQRAAPNAAALAVIPELPLENAVAPELSLAVNLALRRLSTLPRWRAREGLHEAALPALERFDVRPRDPAVPALSLSGGNLQKLVAARELDGLPAAVVACYPTMGLDAAARAQILGRLFALAAAGSAVLWISEDLDELLQDAHRIGVLREGRLVAVVDAAATTPAALGAWMTGAGTDLARDSLSTTAAGSA